MKKCLMQRVLFTGAMLWCGAAFAQVPFGLDTTFRTAIDTWYVSSIVPLADGDILLSGHMKFPGEVSERLLARLDASGQADLAFPASPGGGKLTAWDDRYYVSVGLGVKRFWEDGLTDWDFNMANSAYWSPLQGGDYHVFPDGRVVITGAHMLSDSIRGFEGLYNLVWFSNTGYLDTTRTHRQCDGTIDRIVALSDGKFLCAGYMAEYEGTPVGRVIRLHPDGSLDTSFNTSVNWQLPVELLPLPDGKYICAGAFRMAGEPDTLTIARFLPNGDLDPTFNNHLQSLLTASNDPPWAPIISVTPITGDRYVITGSFDQIEGQPHRSIALIDTAGVLVDEPLALGAGCGAFEYFQITYQTIGRIVPGPTGTWYIHGAYHGYDDGVVNDTNQRMVSRLYGLDVGIEVSPSLQSLSLTLQPNPAAGEVTIGYENGTSPTVIVVRDVIGREVFRKTADATGSWLWDISTTPAGTYVVTVLEEGSVRAAQRLVVAR